MSNFDFTRAEYGSSVAVVQDSDGQPTEQQLAAAAAFPKAVLYGAFAAVFGCIGYAMVWSMGFMVGIVAIGIGWLVAKAMLMASGGIGGRLYQIASAVMTYLAVSCGKLVLPALAQSRAGHPYGVGTLVEWAMFGPMLRLQAGRMSVLGLIILGVGVQYAWKTAAGEKPVPPLEVR